MRMKRKINFILAFMLVINYCAFSQDSVSYHPEIELAVTSNYASVASCLEKCISWDDVRFKKLFIKIYFNDSARADSIELLRNHINPLQYNCILSICRSNIRLYVPPKYHDLYHKGLLSRERLCMIRRCSAGEADPRH